MHPPDSSATSSAPDDLPAAIVVPVHGAAEALDRCLESLAAHTDLGRHPLVLVIDGPQPHEVEAVISSHIGGLSSPRVVRHAARRGFPAAANRGLAELPERDAVLVNSDVETSPGWLEKLTRAARSRPCVASVTPLTNNGTLASVPRWFEENALPAGWTTASLAGLIERISERRYPEIPTGVGFCLYIRREALAAVGPFDEASFRNGYGEEVDWCLRATDAGFLHLLDDATFVFHRGAGSFGAEAKRRVARAQRTLARRHPDYEHRVASFIRTDSLRSILDSIRDALMPPRRPTGQGAPLRLVHVVHGWPPWNHAGTETYAARLVRSQGERHHVAVYSRFAGSGRDHGAAIELVDRGARVRLIANDFLQRDPLSRNALHDSRLVADFGRLLDEERAGLVHIHHLAGHCLTLAHALKRRRLPVVWQLQDWWAACARSNLLDSRRMLCSGPSPRRCAACLPPTRVVPRALWGSLLHVLRRALVRRALSTACAIVAGSRCVVDDHRRLGLLPSGVPVHICDYGVPSDCCPASRRRARSAGEPLRLGFLGSLAPHKGLHVLAKTLAELPPGCIELHVWGEPRQGAYAEEVRLAAGAACSHLQFHPPFVDELRSSVFSRIDLLVAPSLGLESYGLATAEALASGVPVLASSRGALADRLAAGGGRVFDPDHRRELLHFLRLALDDPHALETWLPEPLPQRSFEDHVEEVEAIYRETLARHERQP